ncbi:MAG: efflux RND transporter periplasmic adaptor subunit [Balneolaceae bacterium]|nr:efflux RND transporter periplasmic adaptor subunit [Balneolaceae bacterium]
MTQIHADLGDTVSPGETLAEIYAVPFRDQFQQAKSQMEQSRSAYVRDSLQFMRQQELYKKDLISSSEYDNARATFQNSKSQFEASRANLTQSRENLNNTDITSPVFGVVLSRNISEGDLASTGQTAYQIANLIGYQCRVYLPFEEWQNVNIGQPVNFSISNQPNMTGQGYVSQISPRLDPTTGLGEVVISLSEDNEHIYPGCACRGNDQRRNA